jgi:hypothetical protein
MGQLADMQIAAAAATPAAAPENPRDGSRLSRPVLRVVEPGEQRVLGTFDALECVKGTFTLRVTSNGRTLALSAKQLTDVEFISYRSTTPGDVKCGAQKSRDRVYATYRPGAAAAGIDGVAIAIEILPDDFVPPNQPR